MTELLTAAQMRAIEAAAIESGAVTGLALMERAGQGVVDAIFATWPDLAATTHRALVLCGPGNNGGDGFVIARLLRDWGWTVDLYLFGDPDRLPPDARTNYQRWQEMGGIGDLSAIDDISETPAPDLVVDALFGTGLVRGVGGVLADHIEKLAERRDAGTRVVAVDIPSGLCSDSGRRLGSVLPADLTVSFHAAKRGHVLADGPADCGRVVVAPIGLGDRWDGHAEGAIAQQVGPPPAALIDKTPGAHKYGHGHALVLSGPMARSGAARLAARGALRIGAGLVTVAAPGSAMMECAAQLTAIMLRRCDEAADLAGLLEDPRFNALCLGPGLGVGSETRARVRVVLASGRAVVLDADALSAFSEDPEVLFSDLHAKCVLTPHTGEFARIFPDLAAELAAPPVSGPAPSRIDAAVAAAARAGCTVLLKGPDTVIAGADGRVGVHSAADQRAAPWLATAGSGDVLAGMVTGLCARGASSFDAAAAAVWLHVEAARAIGPGLIAEDLPETLPEVLKTLLASAH